MAWCYVGCGDDRVLHWVWGWHGVTLGVGMTWCYIGCRDDRVLHCPTWSTAIFDTIRVSYMKRTGVVLTFYASAYVHTCKLEYACIVDATAWFRAYIKRLYSHGQREEV